DDQLAVHRHPAADQTGVAALGNDGDAARPTHVDDRGDLVQRARTNDRTARADESPGPVGAVTGNDVLLREHVRRADDGPQVGEEARRHAYSPRKTAARFSTKAARPSAASTVPAALTISSVSSARCWSSVCSRLPCTRRLEPPYARVGPLASCSASAVARPSSPSSDTTSVTIPHSSASA